MKLNYKNLCDKEFWKSRNYNIPEFNIEKMIQSTKENPVWVHFGSGNIFKAFPAMLQQKLLNEGKTDKGIVVAEGYDCEIIDAINRPCDNLNILVILKSDGSIEKTVVGSMSESLKADPEFKEDFDRLKEIFRKDSLQMASFTITEKGYYLVDKNNNTLKDVEEDFKNGYKKPISYMGKIASLVYERYLSGKKKLALVSMDNCSHNGSKLYDAVNKFAEVWEDNGLVEKGFKDYINNPQLVSFPWSMIDKITPRPDLKVMEVLINDGIEDVEPKVTNKNTYVSNFTNSEECEYLVIEDWFPNGRPALEEAGVKFTDRNTVDKVEKMKVCTCLNPLHTALAVFGCLLSYTRISEEMNDKELKELVKKIGYEEGLPVVVNPRIINPKDFIDEVINIRIPNPFMPDTPQRIATDTSQKLSIRYGETIKAYVDSDELEIEDLKYIPLVIAGWCRYLLGVDDEGKEFELSFDPMLSTLKECVKDIKLGQRGLFTSYLMPILSNENIFGIDLYRVGLAKQVEEYFEELISGIGAVRRTLIKYLD
ncbi:mannitol dehydrogenase family protein [Clostridium sp. SM-530-WT-3G]|uniref:mannitol dehydrogenase family protein n=1 Tax=Clostridium sp. SM-530-WT-3G TaxID=2725303 RepID=UPI00145CD411|nr:mannitol dehydrogenase family protein [Clostridium sp. SM-530-WT-3G]NME82153.1 mannitol dehydrogenase family protein [Clostridium sp. SM-530-WT-3G]